MKTLTPDDVVDIRRMYASGAKQRDIGSKFGVSRSTVGLVLNGKTWAHLSGGPIHTPRTMSRESINDRMDRLTEKGGPDSCWTWNGTKNYLGYGLIYFRARATGAHRVAWILANGEIPKGMFVCHKCDVPSCVNPSHMFLGTHTDNMRDAKAKGRLRAGGGIRNSKLTQEQVESIRKMVSAGWTGTSVARHFGVSASTVYSIVTGRTWAPLPVPTEEE